MPKCRFEMPEGRRCRAWAKTGSDYCAQHLPTEERAAPRAYSTRSWHVEADDTHPVVELEVRPSVATYTPAASGLMLIPHQLSQPTFQEARTAAEAVADGPALQHWSERPEELSLLHFVPGQSLAVKLVPGAMLTWAGQAPSLETLQEEVRSLEFPAALLYYVSLALALAQDFVTVTLDELVSAIGWQPRSVEQRQTMRQKIWRWLLLFGSLHVIGQRAWVYRDRRSGKEMRITSEDALFTVTGTLSDAGPPGSGTAAPIEVTFTAGPWIRRWRQHPDVASYFGDLRRCAAIPAGRTSGAWAQAVGLALNQRWRERSAHAFVVRDLNGSVVDAQFQHFTRRDLLGLFTCQPSVEEILAGHDPGRARAYWDQAIELLQTHGVIGSYREVTPLPAQRQGWQRAWLEQPLDIRPPREYLPAIAQIARGAQQHNGSAPGRRGRAGKRGVAKP
jgi:hypothetical protein